MRNEIRWTQLGSLVNYLLISLRLKESQVDDMNKGILIGLDTLAYYGLN